MGTTYEVQVDIWQEAIPRYDMPAKWESVSRWELGKDYGFAAEWYQLARSGWPPDVTLIGEDAVTHSRGYEFFEGRHWEDGALLELVEPEEPRVWLLALKEHVRFLVARGLKVRVLSWEW